MFLIFLKHKGLKIYVNCLIGTGLLEMSSPVFWEEKEIRNTAYLCGLNSRPSYKELIEFSQYGHVTQKSTYHVEREDPNQPIHV